MKQVDEKALLHIKYRQKTVGLPATKERNILYRKRIFRTEDKRKMLRHYLRASCDTTRSCNLRCKFCFNDFSKPAFQMTPAIFSDMLKIVKYVPGAENMDGQGFYYSCLWEPSLNPDYITLLKMIPPEYKHKIFFTSNFARKFDEETIREIAKANVEYINISIETFDRETYKKLTGGTDFNYEMFMENLQMVARVFRETPNAPKLRYISMALKSNLEELETIIEKGQTELHGYVSEIRTPFFGEYLHSFEEELLSGEEIQRLKEKLDQSEKRIVYALEEVSCPQKNTTSEEKAHRERKKEGEDDTVLPPLLLEPLPDYYYDMQIEATGDIFWRGDNAWHTYEKGMDVDQILLDGLKRLMRREAKRHVRNAQELCAYFACKQALFLKTDFVIDNQSEDDLFLELRGWSGVRSLNSEKIGKILVLTSTKDKTKKYYFLCADEPRQDVKDAVCDRYENAGFRVLIDKEELFGTSFTAGMYFYDREENHIVYKAKRTKKIVLEKKTSQLQ